MSDFDQLKEEEFTYDTLNLDKAYDVFNASYIKSTGKSWEKDKFLERAKNWTFYGDINGYVAVRTQHGGMIKLVGVAGSLKSIYRGMQEVKSKYANSPLWGMVSKEIADQIEKLGLKPLKLKNDISSKIFLKLIKTIIPASVFGGAEIKGLNPDGTISFVYSDIGEANKVLVGNDVYFNQLKDKVLSHEKIPEFMKEKITNLFTDSGLISEKRRGGEKNPKSNYIDMLEKYSNDDSIYVTFTHHPKAGMNPKSNYDTPLGIYCYPLKAAIKFYGYDSNGIIRFPFASDRPYLYILKEKPGTKKLLISEYTAEQGEKDIQTIVNNHKDELPSDVFDELIETAKSDTRFKKLGVGKFWYFCNLLSGRLEGKSTVSWNKLLRKDLGYGLIVDDKGDGVIHGNERVQAFFTEKSKFDIVDYLINPSPNDFAPHDWAVSKSNSFLNKSNQPVNFRIVANDLKSAQNLLKIRGKDSEIAELLDKAKDKRKMIDIIMDIKGNKLSPFAIGRIIYLTHGDDEKNKMIRKIISLKKDNLRSDDIRTIIENSKDKLSSSNYILDAIGDNIQTETIKVMMDYSPNSSELILRIINTKGSSLTGEDVKNLLEYFHDDANDEKRTKIAERIFELKKDSMDKLLALILLKNYGKNSVEKIFPYITNFLEDDVLNYVLRNSENKDSLLLKILDYKKSFSKRDLFLFLKESIGTNVSNQVFDKIINLIDFSENTEALDIILSNVKENKYEFIKKIASNQKNLTQDNIGVMIATVDDVKKLGEIIGPSNLKLSVDFLSVLTRAKDREGIIDLIMQSDNIKSIWGENIFYVLENTKNPILRIDQLMSIDPNIFNSPGSLRDASYYFKRDSNKNTQSIILNKFLDVLDLNKKDVSNIIISWAISLDPSLKYLNKFIDLKNVNLNSIEIRDIFETLTNEFPSGHADIDNVIEKIYNYKKETLNQEDLKFLIEKSRDLEKVLNFVGKNYAILLTPSSILRSRDKLKTVKFLLNSKNFTSAELSDISSKIKYRIESGNGAAAYKYFVDYAIKNRPDIFDYSMISGILGTSAGYKPEEKLKTIEKIMDSLLEDGKLNSNIVYDIISAASDYLEYKQMHEVFLMIIDKKKSKLTKEEIKSISSHSGIGARAHEIVRKLIEIFGKEETEKLYLEFGYLPVFKAAVALPDKDDTDDGPVLIERHLRYKEYFKYLYS